MEKNLLKGFGEKFVSPEKRKKHDFFSKMVEGIKFAAEFVQNDNISQNCLFST